MACSSKPGVKPFLDFIEATTGQKITQTDWHDIRQLATEEHVVAWTEGNERGLRFGDKLPKSKATTEQVITSIGNLKTSLGEDASFPMATRLQSQNVTQGTVHCVNYLAKNGVGATLAKIRHDREVKRNAAKTVVNFMPATEFMDRFEASEYGNKWSEDMASHPDFIYRDGYVPDWVGDEFRSEIDEAWEREDYDEVGYLNQMALTDALRRDGMSTPVEVFENSVINGHHRVLAALDAGVPVKFVQLTREQIASEHPELL